MLSRIFIQNFALIDRLEIDLHRGLQVITGETGAGKSIILGALRLILGERAGTKSMADPESKSVVETEFAVNENLKTFFDENDLDFEPQTIIRREILPSGKSRAFVNDVPVTLEVLKSLSSQLIDIHSQFETSNLFSEEYQFRIIDGLGDNKVLIKRYQQNYSDFQKLNRKLSQLKNQLSEGNKEADYKQFLLAELEELQLDDLDYAMIQEQLSEQENAGMISENLAEVITKFDLEEIGIIPALNDSRNRLTKISEVAPKFNDLSRRLDESFLELKDILNEIENEAGRLESDPETLSKLNLLNDRLNALFLKHSVKDLSGLIAVRDKISGEQSGFAETEEQLANTEKEIEEKKKLLGKLASELSANRQKTIPVFTKKIEALLKQLGLEKARIEVKLEELPDFNIFGKEKIAILFQANSGFPMNPIQDAISGGERSRVMLAVKKIMAENSELPTLILDEIDTGVSGKVAEEMGNVMREMSKDLQLIVITHLAQVAAKGNNNYKVMKQEIGGRTQSTLVPLTGDEKLQEIAQLLSGTKITVAALQQAEELIGK